MTLNPDTTAGNVRDAHTLATQSLAAVEHPLDRYDYDELVKRAELAMKDAQNVYRLARRLQEGI